jgi:hypothetical protein
MAEAAAFAYPGARLQARHADRPNAATWEQLERVEDFARFVQLARDSGLRAWVVHFGPEANAHQIEQQLRMQFRILVDEVAKWVPAGWRPAVQWVSLLPDLPGLEHLRDGQRPYDWMIADPVFSGVIDGSPDPAVSAWLKRSHPRGLLISWVGRWRELWGSASSEARIGLHILDRLMIRAADQSGGLEGDGAPQVETLGLALKHVFRRRAQQPAGAFAFLVLIWLDVRRLRGGLLRRRLM